MPVARHLLRPTRELGRAILKRSPIWSCTGWGLQSFPGHPGNWCALTAPFHPYLQVNPVGGILSVALSFVLPRLHVMEHPALWCSDFPPDIHLSGDRLDCSNRILIVNLTDFPNILFSGSWGKTSGCRRDKVRYTSVAECSYYTPGTQHLSPERWRFPPPVSLLP